MPSKPTPKKKSASEPRPEAKPDPHIQAAYEEEQALLDRAVQQAQAQHLMSRCVTLNAEARRARDKASADDGA